MSKLSTDLRDLIGHQTYLLRTAAQEIDRLHIALDTIAKSEGKTTVATQAEYARDVLAKSS